MKYVINKNSFKNIQSEQQAYFLGFLMADGYISENKRNIFFCLNVKDKEILEKYVLFLQTNRPIKTVLRKNGLISYRVTVNSKEMVEDLKILGFGQKKSYKTLIPQQISINLLRHYIRGYFDGDGSISKRKTNNSICLSNFNISVASCSKIFIQQIKKVLNELNIKTSIYTRPTYEVILINNKKSLLTFLHYIYDNSCIYLERKRKIFETIMKIPVRIKRGNQSKYFGVSKNGKKFRAYLKYNKKFIHIGTFDSDILAAKAYNQRAILLGYEKTMLNII